MHMISQYCSFNPWKQAKILSNVVQDLHSTICGNTVQRSPLTCFDQVLKGKGIVVAPAAQARSLEA